MSLNTNILPGETRRKRLMIVRLSALGDVAMTLPVAYSLAKQYPQLDVYFVTRPFFARMFINRPPNLHIVEADYKGEHKGMDGTRRLINKLLSYKPQYIADLHNVSRSWTIDFFMQIHGVRIAMVDKERSRRKSLLAGNASLRHDYIDRYVAVLQKLGFPIELTFRSLFEDIPAQPPFEPDKPSVGIAPFARYLNKTYPPEMMEQVVEGLTTQGVNVLLFGGRGQEAATMSAWAERYPGCRSVAGEFGLEQELALMSRLDAMISMDSANQHLASLTGIPVISVWGSTTPTCGFSPYRHDPQLDICEGLACQPCTTAGSSKCPLGTLDCMRKLTPQRIIELTLSTIKR